MILSRFLPRLVRRCSWNLNRQERPIISKFVRFYALDSPSPKSFKAEQEAAQEAAKQQYAESMKRNSKIAFYVLGGSIAATVIGSVIAFGKPRTDPDGNTIRDEFTDSVADPTETYQSVFSNRYANPTLSKLFSEKYKVIQWRKLWLILAESEMELGFSPIKQEHLDEMKANLENIDWEFQRKMEKETRHDVMSHLKAFEEVCPKVKKAGILHAGATSAFIQDNADVIIMRDALDFLLNKVATVLDRIGKFSEKHKSMPTVGRTHYQPATMVTVGKRGAMWAHDLLMAFKRLVIERRELRFRGVKGATGTQASFLVLFKGDKNKVEELDQRVTGKAGFTLENSGGLFTITGQTYTRLQDACVLTPITYLAAAVEKICMDLRMLQEQGEILEPFEPNQIGSSAMPYKRNPMRAERCCGLARQLMQNIPITVQTAAMQGFERTLDDSSSRRTVIPESFLCADVILTTLQNIFEGIVVREEKIRQNVDTELPFLVLETILMELTKCGESRQEAHEKIKKVAMQAHEMRQKDQPIDLFAIINQLGFKEYFSSVADQLRSMLADTDRRRLIGRAPEQVDKFQEVELWPALSGFKISETKADLKI